MRPTMSGVKNCITSETRLVAMELSTLRAPQPQSRYTPKASSKLDPNQKGLGVSKVCFAQPSYPVFGSRRADHSTRHHETDSTERLTTTHNVRGFIADYRVRGGILRRSLKPS